MAGKKILRWHSAAVADLEEAHGYLFERNPEAAQRFAIAVLEAAERLQDFPEIGAVARDLRPLGRYRHWIYSHYRLIYRIDGELIWLLRLWDSRRNPQDLRVGET